MAKKVQKKTSAPKVASPSRFTLTPPQQVLIALGAFFLLILIYFFPIVFERQVPPSTDIIAWKGNAQSILEARKQFSYIPLWANNVFSGMPAHLISLWAPFEQPARYLIDGLAKIFTWYAVYYLIGALGMILLMRSIGLSTITALFSAIAFVWWPNLIGMLEAGHNSKVQTIMLIPLVLYFFFKMMRRVNLLNWVLLTISFSLAVRAGHYQIVFYLGLAMVFFGIVELYRLIKEKEYAGSAVRIGMVVAALVLGSAMSAFHTLQVREYSKYTIRGGTGEAGSTGLDINYATQWSLHPGEIYNFIIPRFWGGHSSQLYTGDAVPQAKGHVIPGYWGHMPFTSTTDYLGVTVVFFALLGIILGWRHREVKTLTALPVFSLFLAFGQHFPYLYRIFFERVPFFDKFRVPTMIVVLVMFSSAALAGIGLQQLLNRRKDDDKKLLTVVAAVFGVLLLLGVAPLLLKNSISFLRPEEARSYDVETVRLLKAIRFDLLKGDALRMLGFLAAAFAAVVAYLRNLLPRSVFAGLVLVLLLADLLPICQRYMNRLVSKSEMDSHFVETDLDRFLLQDAEPHRIFPLGEIGGDAHWSYFHQSIEGYHPAKLRIYQDIRESCLFEGKDEGFFNAQAPINWNVVNMLNAKYLIVSQQLLHPYLEPAFYDQTQKLWALHNTRALPRAFCVGRTEVISDRSARLKRLNEASFRPDSTAIVEKEIGETLTAPSTWSAKVTRYEPNYIDLSVTGDAQTLLVLSEIYYPAGWYATVNDRPTEIYKVNHVLRGVVVPAGESTVSFKLEPQSFKTGVIVTAVSGAVVYLLLIIAVFPYFLPLLRKVRV